MKVEKLKNGKYKIIDQEFEIETYDEIIVKHNLLYKQLTKELVKEIEKENEFYDFYFKMVKLISKRLRSESEIRRELQNCDFKEDIISKLKYENLINDSRFTEAYILDKINFTKAGKNKIKNDLAQHEIDEEVVEGVLSKIDDSIFSGQLEKLIRKKLATNNKKSKIAIKEKILYEFNSLGYEKEEILHYFDLLFKDNKDIYEKELEKIKSKLAKKYSGNELDRKLKEKMYRLGFREWKKGNLVTFF